MIEWHIEQKRDEEIPEPFYFLQGRTDSHWAGAYLLPSLLRLGEAKAIAYAAGQIQRQLEATSSPAGPAAPTSRPSHPQE